MELMFFLTNEHTPILLYHVIKNSAKAAIKIFSLQKPFLKKVWQNFAVIFLLKSEKINCVIN